MTAADVQTWFRIAAVLVVIVVVVWAFVAWVVVQEQDDDADWGDRGGQSP